MNGRRRSIPCALALLLLAGCGGKEEESGLPVSWETKTDRWAVEGCAEGEPCSHVTFTYPVFAGEPDFAALLNRYVRSELVRPEGEEGNGPAPEEYAASFLRMFRDFKSDFPESPQQWFLERTIDVLPSLPGTISLRSEEEVYSGGAHGNQTTNLVTFDPVEGRRVRIEDLLAPGTAAALDRVAETRFREARGLAPEEDLAEAGFWFGEDGRFRIGPNFAAAAEGLHFRFDPYEVGPYSIGPTDFVVPWEDLDRILRKEWAARLR